MFSKKFFDRLGKKIIKMYKAHIFDRAKDVKGNGFRGYSQKYGEMKREGSLSRQWTGSTGTTAPMVTKDFYNDLKLRKSSATGFVLGWDSYGGRVNYLGDMNRLITTDDQPLDKDSINEINRQVLREIVRVMPKHKHHKIVLGK